MSPPAVDQMAVHPLRPDRRAIIAPTDDFDAIFL